MNKIFQKSIQRGKQEIKNRWLAGESVPSIALDCEVSPRDIYYHLGVLTAEDKALHAKNSSLRMTKRKEDNAKTEISKGTKHKTTNSLDDFEQQTTRVK